MLKSRLISALFVPCLALAGCAADATDLADGAPSDESTGTAEQGLGTLGPQLSSDALVGDIVVSPDWFIGYTVYDYYGRKRLLKITNGNAVDGCLDKLEYDVQLKLGAVWGPTRKLIVQNGFGGITVSVQNPATNATLAKAVATKNDGVTLHSATAACGAGPHGPFVLDLGAPCLYDVDLYLLLDQQVLTHLYKPSRLGGVSVGTDAVKKATVASIFNALVTDNEILWDSYRFRADLNTNSGALDHDKLFDVLGDYLGKQGNPASTPGDHHDGHIDHSKALADENEDYTDLGHHAAFLDGHRAYMREFEGFLQDGTTTHDYLTPFRRMPLWSPAKTVPASFSADSDPAVAASDLSNTSVPGGVPAAIQYGAMCDTYSTSSTPRLDAMKKLGNTGAGTPAGITFATSSGNRTFNSWHGTVHTGIGGRFGSLSTAAYVPLFFAWHTTVDTFWSSLQQCYVKPKPIQLSQCIAWPPVVAAPVDPTP